MFNRYSAYFQYRKAVSLIAKKAGYEDSNITFIYPWGTPSKLDPTDLICVFDILDFQAPNSHLQILKSNHVTLYEVSERAKLSLRAGLPQQLVYPLLDQVRRIATQSAANGPTSFDASTIPKEFQTYLSLECVLDVTVWIDGMLRGSRVVHGRPLTEALAAASKDVVRDTRFKPVSADELHRTHFELIIVPDIWLPVTALDLEDAEIPKAIASRIDHNGTPKAWFMPNVGNQHDYSKPNIYFSALAQKGKLSRTNKTFFYFAPTFSYVLSPNGTAGIVLSGLIPKETPKISPKEQSSQLAEHITRHIDSDGYSPIIQRISSPVYPALDVTRLAFMSVALAEYIHFSNDQKSQDAQARLYGFLKNCIGDQDILPQCYLLQSEHYLSQQATAKYMQNVIKYSVSCQTESAVFISIQVMKTRVLYGEDTDQETRSDVETIYTHWQKHKEVISPVIFADLLLILSLLKMTDRVLEMVAFLGSKQLPDGTFTYKPVAYTRGIGKIAEACAGIPEAHEICSRAISWLERMQYTEETMYHIPLLLQEGSKSGLRHDYWNRDVWLDGSAHALVAFTRLAYAQAHRSHRQM